MFFEEKGTKWRNNTNWVHLLGQRTYWSKKERSHVEMLHHFVISPEWRIFKQNPGDVFFLPARTVHAVITVCRDASSWVYLYGTSFAASFDIR